MCSTACRRSNPQSHHDEGRPTTDVHFVLRSQGGSVRKYLILGEVTPIRHRPMDNNPSFSAGNQFVTSKWSVCLRSRAAAEERLSALSVHAQTVVDSAAVTCVRLNLYTTLDQSDSAVAVGLDYLRGV